jgi:hypothetical protein
MKVGGGETCPLFRKENMYELLILAIYSAVILIFVPLEKIAKAQTWVKDKIRQIKDKA